MIWCALEIYFWIIFPIFVFVHVDIIMKPVLQKVTDLTEVYGKTLIIYMASTGELRV